MKKSILILIIVTGFNSNCFAEESFWEGLADLAKFVIAVDNAFNELNDTESNKELNDEDRLLLALCKFRDYKVRKFQNNYKTNNFRSTHWFNKETKTINLDMLFKCKNQNITLDNIRIIQDANNVSFKNYKDVLILYRDNTDFIKLLNISQPMDEFKNLPLYKQHCFYIMICILGCFEYIN